MHYMAITRGTILLLAILTLTSCLRPNRSKDEAQKASIAWIKQGGTVTVLTPPNESEIKAQWRRERIVKNNKCEFAKQEIEDLERSVPPDNFEEKEIQAKYKNLIAIRGDACSDREIRVKTIDLALKQEETRDELGRRTAETRIDKRRAYCREQAEALVANEKIIKQKST